MRLQKRRGWFGLFSRQKTIEGTEGGTHGCSSTKLVALYTLSWITTYKSFLEAWSLTSVYVSSNFSDIFYSVGLAVYRLRGSEGGIGYVFDRERSLGRCEETIAQYESVEESVGRTCSELLNLAESSS